jgi:hypothetical protein
MLDNNLLLSVWISRVGNQLHDYDELAINSIMMIACKMMAESGMEAS